MTVPSNVSSVWPQHPVLQYCFISCFSTSQFNFILTLFSSLILTLGTYLFKTFLNQITNIFSTLFCIRGNVIHCHRCLSRNMTTLFFYPALLQWRDNSVGSTWVLLSTVTTVDDTSCIVSILKALIFLLSLKLRNPPQRHIGDTPLFWKKYEVLPDLP